MIFHKYHARQTECDGIKFPSAREADCYKTLKLQQISGEVVFFLRQVPFRLPGNVTYWVDFVVFNSDGCVRFVDSKGMKTQTYKVKKRLVESLYPIEIEEW